MPVGIQDGPAIFQRVMDQFLRGWIVRKYFDDIIGGSSSDKEEELLAEHNRDVPAMLDRLQREGVVALVNKTVYFAGSAEFCGHEL